MAPGAGDCPADTPTQAPERAPQIKRAISPTGAVRLGVEGSLSVMISRIASTVNIATAAVEPMNASRVPARLSQPRCAAQAVTAGAVKERIPDTIPIAKARTKTKVALMPRDVSPMPVSVKKQVAQALLPVRFCSGLVLRQRMNTQKEHRQECLCYKEVVGQFELKGNS
jgi:hypothetical protein